MKHLVIRFAVALLTFTLGLAVQRVLISRTPEPRQVQNVEPMVPQTLSIHASATPFATSLPLPMPSPQLIFDYKQAKFNPSVTYLPVGQLPREFREVYGFEIAADEVRGETIGSLVLYTHMSDRQEGQDAQFALVTERRVFFVTSSPAEGDFEYRFDGHFLRGSPLAWADTNTAVLRGTLTKTLNGLKVSECAITFRAEYWGC
jgi:hypothetical protein